MNDFYVYKKKKLTFIVYKSDIKSDHQVFIRVFMFSWMQLKPVIRSPSLPFFPKLTSHMFN